jgi:hypothetical protein
VVPADPETGRFDGNLSLTPNRAHQVRVYATSLGGAGLPSAPAEAPVLVDTRLPVVRITRPAPGACVRGIVPLAAEALDTMEAGEAWSGLATLQLGQAGQVLARGTNPTPESGLPFGVPADWDSKQVPDGSLTLTATGRDRAGNAATDTVTVTVDNTPPTVSLAGLPADGIVRGPVTLTVMATDLTAGIASVALYVDGALRASGAGPTVTYTLNPQGLAGSHTLTATATDRAGNPATTTRTFTVQSLTVEITTPGTGATIAGDRVVVKGTVSGAAEVGVVVNGVVALVNGQQWVAELRVAPGTAIIRATAYGNGGVSATTSITVQVAEVTEPSVLLLASPESGIGPLAVRWQVRNQTGAALVRFEIDAYGTGSYGPPMPTLDGVQTTYTTPGLISPKVRATDAQGRQYTASAMINVLDRQQMDTLLQAKWGGVKAALQAGSIETALSLFAPNQQARYRAIFAALAEQLPTIATAMREIELVQVIGPQAQYRIRRMQEWGGQQIEVSYYIFFVRGADGLWRMREF